MLRTLLAAAAAAAIAGGAQAQTVKIAILGPMAFVQGENNWAGAEMARNEIQSVPDATNAIERVITRDKVDFLVGGFRSEAVLAMQEVAADNKKLFLGAGAAHPQLGAKVEKDYNRFKYWFRVTPLHVGDLVKASFAVLGVAAAQF